LNITFGLAGIAQPWAVHVDEQGDAQCLVLMREAYVLLMTQYPEQHNQILNSIIETHGVNRSGTVPVAPAHLLEPPVRDARKRPAAD